MTTVNTKKTIKADLLKGAKLAKTAVKPKKIKPEEIDFSNYKQIAELLGVTPELLDPTIKKPRFVKTDMLSANRIAKALHLDQEIITKEMQKLHRENKTIRVDNIQEYYMVVVDRNVHNTPGNLRLHPLAIKPFLAAILSITKNAQNNIKSNIIANEGR